jgi:cysteine desulfurase
VPVDLGALGADAVAVAAHKMGGPAGAGALFVRRGHDLSPLLRGGGQERGRRPGTPDVVTAAGFGAAAEGVGRRLAAMPRVARLRDRFELRLLALGAALQAAEGPRVATVTHAAFPGWRGPILVAALDVEGLCASSGAACSSGLAEPSPVIRAMYPDEPLRAEAGVRFSFGPETTEDELQAAETILESVSGRAPRART